MHELERFGQVLEIVPPRAKLRIPRGDVPKTLAAILAQHVIEDIVVEDPPLEEVIADAFARARSDQDESADLLDDVTVKAESPT